MNAYQAMMLAGQRKASQGQGMAQPVHHILEEKPAPTTQDPNATQVVGSTWRQDAEAQMNAWYRQSQDQSLPLHTRKHLNDLANRLKVDIGEEDLYHQTQKEPMVEMQGNDSFANLMQRRNQARAGMDQTAPQGMSPGQAQRKGWIPPR